MRVMGLIVIIRVMSAILVVKVCRFHYDDFKSSHGFPGSLILNLNLAGTIGFGVGDERVVRSEE